MNEVMENPHVMSKFATELDCLRARDKWFQEKLAEVVRERDDMKELWGEMLERYGEYRDTAIAARAEIEALRKDAERYRWLREIWDFDQYFAPLMNLTHATLDAAIDQAMEDGE